VELDSFFDTFNNVSNSHRRNQHAPVGAVFTGRGSS